jgi:hypothetical protein
LAVAWTNPKTWSFGEILTSTDMNTYVRDNTEFLFERGVIQVVQTVKTDTFSASVAGLGGISGDVTGLTVSITPSTNTAKVLVTVCINIAGASDTISEFVVLYRNGSALTGATGDAAGSAQRVSAATVQKVGGTGYSSMVTFSYLDSPASTSAQTYSVRLQHARDGSATRTIYVNQTSSTATTADIGRTASTITAIEVAA